MTRVGDLLPLPRGEPGVQQVQLGRRRPACGSSANQSRSWQNVLLRLSRPWCRRPARSRPTRPAAPVPLAAPGRGPRPRLPPPGAAAALISRELTCSRAAARSATGAFVTVPVTPSAYSPTRVVRHRGPLGKSTGAALAEGTFQVRGDQRGGGAAGQRRRQQHHRGAERARASAAAAAAAPACTGRTRGPRRRSPSCPPGRTAAARCTGSSAPPSAPGRSCRPPTTRTCPATGRAASPPPRTGPPSSVIPGQHLAGPPHPGAYGVLSQAMPCSSISGEAVSAWLSSVAADPQVDLIGGRRGGQRHVQAGAGLPPRP